MRKASRSILVAVMAVCLFGASATMASAFPTKTTSCLGACHPAGLGATVGASLVSTSSTTATYDVAMTASTGSAWAVFDGTNKVAVVDAATSFTVDRGKTYELFAVDKTSSNAVVTSVVAPAVEPTTAPEPSLDEAVAPITNSDAVASYTGDASVKLTSTDGAGRGVAYMYYSVDGARVHLITVGATAQTTIVIAAPSTGTASHTITFWAQDDAGNVEVPKTVTLSVKSLTTTKTASTAGIRLSSSSVVYGTRIFLTGTIQPNAAGQRVTLQRRSSTGSWVNLTSTPVTLNASSVYYMAFSTTPRGTWYFRTIYAGTSTVAASTSSSLKLVVR